MSLRLSIVAPMHDEEECIEKFVTSITGVMKQVGLSYELILVDDGSKDQTFRVASDLAKKDKRIRVLKFSRNFGHQMAIFAGLKYAEGNLIVMMDSDLQHPPELIPKMLSLSEEGYEIVHTVRKSVVKETFFKRVSSKAFYHLINKLSYTHIIHGSADFRLITKKVNNVFCSIDEYDRFNRGLFSWIGFNSVNLEYDAHERYAGTSSYTFAKMFSLALDSVTSFSGKPLRMSFYMGLSTLLVLAMYVCFVVVNFCFTKTVHGWSSLFFTLTLLGSVQLISVGVLGEYIFRIYREVKRRPHYIVEKDERLLADNISRSRPNLVDNFSEIKSYNSQHK